MAKRSFAVADMRLLLGLVSVFAVGCSHARGKDFNAFVDEEWDWAMRAYPENATSFGDFRFNAELTDWSAEAVEARKQHYTASLAELKAFDRAALDAREQVTYDVLSFDLSTGADLAKFNGEYIQLTQMGGIHTAMADLAGYAPKRTPQQIDEFLTRLRKTPAQVAQVRAWLEKGLAAGVTPPKQILERVPELVRNQITDDPRQSPIFDTYFADVAPEQQQQAVEILRTQVFPAYRELADYLAQTYVPQSRTSIGWTSVPNGAEWYQAKIREQTTLDMTPDEVHAIGLAEVERIGRAMEELKTSTGFTKDMPAFFDFLRRDPRFFYAKADDLVTGYRDIAKRIDGELPNLFGRLPRNPYGVKPVPAFSEQVQTTAYYQPGSIAGGRSGTFFCNTYNLASRPKWEMEALTMHEAVPGHHLQMALAEEVENVPAYRKYAFNNAFVEGWGLYAESLGDRLGFYSDPYAKFGQLTYEMWRAIRLVVDTGMHAKGWTRDQAIAYFEQHAGKSRHDITVEVDRYLAWPAQALGYKLGQLKIIGLRRQAEAALGEKFDIRAFHDVVLAEGTLPLTVLEARITQWIASQR